MNTTQQLQLRYKLNALINQGKPFEQIITDKEILLNLHDFLESSQGKIWLKKKNGQKFLKWQKS